MANSRVTYNGDGVTTQRVVPFPFLDRTHVTVFVDGVSTAFTWINDGLVSISPAPANGTLILIKRATSPTARLVDYIAGSLGEEELDTDSLQAFYLAQESVDAAESGIIEDVTDGKWDGQGKVLKDIGDPTSPQDVVTKAYGDANYGGAAAIAAANSAVAADASADASALSAAAASASESAADASADAAALSAADAATAASNSVFLTGDQTVAGIKTFSSSPLVPAVPSGATAVVPKKYVDEATAHGQCRINYASATSITLDAFNGQRIKINGQFYDIPSTPVDSGNPSAGGVHVDGVAGQSLAAGTFYYVYCFLNGASLSLDFSTTPYVVDTAVGNVGVRVKSSDGSRSLVGIVYANGSSQFESRYVRSWFNDVGVSVRGSFNTNPATAGGPVELSSSIRTSLILWPGEQVIVNAVGSVTNSNTSAVSYTNLNVDGVNNAVGKQASTFQAAGTGYYIDFNLYDARNTYNAGLHYWSLNGQVSAGTGTWAGVTGAGDAEICVTATGVK